MKAMIGLVDMFSLGEKICARNVGSISELLLLSVCGPGCRERFRILLCAVKKISKKPLLSKDKRGFLLERVMGIEPTSQPWEGHILPMNYTRDGFCIIAKGV